MISSYSVVNKESNLTLKYISSFISWANFDNLYSASIPAILIVFLKILFFIVYYIYKFYYIYI